MKFITYDVEHGSCHVLRIPNESEDVMMFDAGSKEDFSPAVHLKTSWGISKLRWLHLSHLDSDHLTDISKIAEMWESPAITTLDYPSVSESTILLHHNNELPAPIEVFYEFRKRFGGHVPSLGHEGYDWGGVRFATFQNSEAHFKDLNNLSSVVFIDYRGTTILLPGDLEYQGWLKHMENPDFVYWLERVDILVASHHGRESGFCSELFDPNMGKCSPILTIISDKGVSDTSVSDKYRAVTQGINFTKNDGSVVTRRVLTTRNDGAISVDVDNEGRLNVRYGFDYSNDLGVTYYD